MQLRVLGASGGIAAGCRTTSYMVDDDILIDAGSGLGDLALEEMEGIRHIMLTHSHLDHVHAIPLLLDSIFDVIDEPIVIHALADTIKALKAHMFNWVMWPDFTSLPHPDKPVLRFQEMAPGDVFESKGRYFHMVPVEHIVPTVGYVVSSPDGAVFAFSGDTSTNDKFWHHLNQLTRLDLLIVECAFGDAAEELCRQAKHYCPSLLAADLVKLEQQPAIYLTHAKPGEEKDIDQEIRRLVTDREVTLLSGGEVFTL